MHSRVLPLSFSLLAAACGGITERGPDPQATADASADAPPAALADTLAINEVAIFQGTKVTLARDGARVDVRNAPVVAGRAAIVRVYVAPATGWKARAMSAELRLFEGGALVATLTDRKTIQRKSTDADLATTFVFSLDASRVTAALTYSIRVHEVTAGPEDPSASTGFPAEGADDLGALAGAERVRLRIVPLKYDADGSGRLPRLSETELAVYRDTIFKLYPTAKVEIDVREPLPWASEIASNGDGWDEALMAVMETRNTDRAPADVYYVGAFAPASSMGKYCHGGCVLGVAPQAGPLDVSQRVAAIVGFDPGSAADTLAQELGHAMGRGHAPCGGAAAPDRKFPYEDGAIGVWGYDLLGGRLIDPSVYSDVMGYCQPQWVSDYTFAGLFKRIVGVNASSKTMSLDAATTRTRVGVVSRDGAIRWARGLSAGRSDDDLRDLVLRDAAGRSVRARGTYHPFDHIPGGVISVDENVAGLAGLRLE